LLEIRPPEGQTWFLPFTKAAVPVVDLGGRRLVSTEWPPKVEPEPDTSE
jgi:ribosomal 30S subunit maturation factor RimM